jgi:hypothetical protein
MAARALPDAVRRRLISRDETTHTARFPRLLSAGPRRPRAHHARLARGGAALRLRGIRRPAARELDLYTEKSGEEIVRQLYNFEDKGGRAVALRPEMTPTLARMVGAKAGRCASRSAGSPCRSCSATSGRSAAGCASTSSGTWTSSARTTSRRMRGAGRRAGRAAHARPRAMTSSRATTTAACSRRCSRHAGVPPERLIASVFRRRQARPRAAVDRIRQRCRRGGLDGHRRRGCSRCSSRRRHADARLRSRTCGAVPGCRSTGWSVRGAAGRARSRRTSSASIRPSCAAWRTTRVRCSRSSTGRVSCGPSAAAAATTACSRRWAAPTAGVGFGMGDVVLTELLRDRNLLPDVARRGRLHRCHRRGPAAAACSGSRRRCGRGRIRALCAAARGRRQAAQGGGRARCARTSVCSVPMRWRADAATVRSMASGRAARGAARRPAGAIPARRWADAGTRDEQDTERAADRAACDALFGELHRRRPGIAMLGAAFVAWLLTLGRAAVHEDVADPDTSSYTAGTAGGGLEADSGR